MKTIKKDQVALTNFTYSKYSLKYTLDSLQRLGAKNIEFYAAMPHFYLGDVGVADIKNVGRMLKAHGLQVINVCPENCTYPVNIASTNYKTRHRNIEQYVTALQAAHEWESPYCLFFPGYALMDEDQQDAWNRGAESIGYLADIAEAYGVQLILEAAPQAASIISSTKKQLALIEQVNSPAMTGMVDLTCIQDIGESLEEVIGILGIDRIRHIHFHNAQEISPGRWEHRIPTEGVLDLAHAVNLLDAHGFTGHFGCEVFAPYEKEPEKAMQAFVDWFATLNLLDS